MAVLLGIMLATLGADTVSTVGRGEIAIRDPFVLADEATGTYYLYGTRPDWGETPFLMYTSRDLETFEGPFSIFPVPEGFWAVRDFWAPEVHLWKGRYHLFASFADKDRKHRATHICVSDSPKGPFVPLGDKPQTPEEWLCLDGTLFVDDAGNPWMVFCHEWVQVTDGEMSAVPLSEDLSKAVGEPMLLFKASEAPWVASKKDKVTDGPFLHRSKTGALLMIWSSFGEDGKYKVGLARSVSGKLEGPWEQQAEPIFEGCGGHGMLFRIFDGQLTLSLHAPNTKPSRPTFFAVEDLGDTLRLVQGNEK